MTKEQFAARLTGREYTEEITKEEEQIAKASGLIVIFGASDDAMEFRGWIRDEIYPSKSEPTLLSCDGVLPPWEDVSDDPNNAKTWLDQKARCKPIQALWCAEGDNGPAWTYKTEIPHATFEILEDGQPFCRGIVILASAVA